jgi:hypothetical protein
LLRHQLTGLCRNDAEHLAFLPRKEFTMRKLSFALAALAALSIPAIPAQAQPGVSQEQAAQAVRNGDVATEYSQWRRVERGPGWQGRPGGYGPRGNWGRGPGYGRSGWRGGGYYGRPYYGRPYYGPRYGYYGRPYYRDNGAAAAAGIVGLATGAIVGGALAQQRATAAPVYPAGSAVAYCAQRFKSYNPATGTYLGYDGRRHACP